jgi:hypothetical protein
MLWSLPSYITTVLHNENYISPSDEGAETSEGYCTGSSCPLKKGNN